MNKPKLRICNLCETEFTVGAHKNGAHRSTKRCPDCCSIRDEVTENLKKMTLEQLTSRLAVVGKHPSWRFSHVRNLNRSWNKDLRKLPCANCRYNKHVELAHRKAIGDFPESATLGEVNSPGNNIQLCRNCHWEFDNGLLSL